MNEVEIFALLGCYAAFVDSYIPKFRDSISVPFSRLKHSSYAA